MRSKAKDVLWGGHKGSLAGWMAGGGVAEHAERRGHRPPMAVGQGFLAFARGGIGSSKTSAGAWRSAGWCTPQGPVFSELSQQSADVFHRAADMADRHVRISTTSCRMVLSITTYIIIISSLSNPFWPFPVQHFVAHLQVTGASASY